MQTIIKRQQNGKVHPMAAMAVGAALGAGAAVAAKYALEDERTKKKVNDMFTSVKDQALDYIEGVTSQKTITNGVKDGKAIVGTAKKTAKALRTEKK